MNFASYFIENKAMFGGFPSHDQVALLELLGFRHFVNLTSSTENKIKPYNTNYNYIAFPVVDGHHPIDDKNLYTLIYKICEIISDDSGKIYIHCKGGHGRSGIIVALVTSIFFNVNADTALRHTNKCHNNRTEMRDIWRNIGSPQTATQKEFVRRLLIIETVSHRNILHNKYERDIYVPDSDITYGSIEDAHTRTGLSYMIIMNHNETDRWKEALTDSGLTTIIVPKQQGYAHALTQLRYNYFIRRDFV